MEKEQYKIVKSHAYIEIEDYIKKYVDVESFIECCKRCDNYGKVWSCPPYNFDVLDYWRGYSMLKVLGRRIELSEEMVHKSYSEEELQIITKEIFYREKDYLTLDLWDLEKTIKNSISLSAGSCSMCGEENCSKPLSKPCRHKSKMRYSIESLGGNVGKTCTELLGERLEWVEEGKLPSHFVLVGGLLYGNKKNNK